MFRHSVPQRRNGRNGRAEGGDGFMALGLLGGGGSERAVDGLCKPRSWDHEAWAFSKLELSRYVGV